MSAGEEVESLLCHGCGLELDLTRKNGLDQCARCHARDEADEEDLDRDEAEAAHLIAYDRFTEADREREHEARMEEEG